MFLNAFEANFFLVSIVFKSLVFDKIFPFELIIVDLYPFNQTVQETSDEKKIIEKIDIAGVSLIRAAAKNYEDVLVISN